MLLITNYKTSEFKRPFRSSLPPTLFTDLELEAKRSEVQAHEATGNRQRDPGLQESQVQAYSHFCSAAALKNPFQCWLRTYSKDFVTFLLLTCVCLHQDTVVPLAAIFESLVLVHGDKPQQQWAGMALKGKWPKDTLKISGSSLMV